jgi:transcription elongation factor GreA
MTVTADRLCIGLSAAARTRLEAELADLEGERVLLAAEPGSLCGDAADIAELAARDMRIEQLDERIVRIRDLLAGSSSWSAAGASPGDPGVVRPGSLVTLRFGRARVAETFVVGARAERDEAHDAITPTSPLGRAVLGARSGAVVEYTAPAGTQRVRVVAVAATGG